MVHMSMLIFAYIISIDQVYLNSLVREVFWLETDQGMVTLFSAVTVQMDNLGIHCSKASLREQLVEYLQIRPYTRDGSSHFREYISAPTVSDDPSNADTEALSEHNEFIKATEDPCLCQQLRWQQYLDRLNAGALQDHTAVRGLANMQHQ